MNDCIVIRDLEVFYRVGVPEEERAKPQRLLISIEMEHNLSRAIAKEDLSKTIDYEAVCRRILGLGEGRSWVLIETLADEIARIVSSEFEASRVGVEVKKFIIPQARYVAVRVSR